MKYQDQVIDGVLDLSNKGLTEFPIEVCQLKNITKLYLSKNRLMSIPPEIGNLTTLQHLYLNGNPLAGLSEWALKLSGYKFPIINPLQLLQQSSSNLSIIKALNPDADVCGISHESITSTYFQCKNKIRSHLFDATTYTLYAKTTERAVNCPICNSEMNTQLFDVGV